MRLAVTVCAGQPLQLSLNTVGETLSFADAKTVVMNNLKQIGLVLLEYLHDDNEKFPPADVSMASVASPAETPLATAKTPCAHIVLIANGHVKATARDGS